MCIVHATSLYFYKINVWIVLVALIVEMYIDFVLEMFYDFAFLTVAISICDFLIYKIYFSCTFHTKCHLDFK